MSQVPEHTVGPYTFPVAASVEIKAYRRCKVNAGNLEYADALDKCVGVAVSSLDADDVSRTRSVAVRSLNFDGALKFIAAGAISAGDELAPAADGKVTTGGGLNWMAVNAAAADGDVVVGYPLW